MNHPRPNMITPHAVSRFIERVLPIGTDWLEAHHLLLSLLPRFHYRLGTWDASALDGLGQGLWAADVPSEAGTFTIVATVDGNGLLRTVNGVEGYGVV